MRVDLSSLNDPRVEPYLNLRERDIARGGGRFIAEGEHLVRRLLASALITESVLLAERRAEEMLPLIPPQVPAYVAPAQLVNDILGFKFHSGVMACGLRPAPRSLEEVLPPSKPRWTLVVCEELNNTDNLGSIIRTAAGLGADAMLLGERSVDPFFRRSIRVSMGTVFQLPIVQSTNLLGDTRRLRERGADCIATTLSPLAEPLARAECSDKQAILFGSEAQGLSPAIVDACNRHVTIPMGWGTDSLNVAVAAGIVLYHFTRGGTAG